MNLFYKRFFRYSSILFIIILVIAVTTFAMDLDCLLSGCHHGCEGEVPCHIERNLINDSHDFNFSQVCDNAPLLHIVISLVPAVTAKSLYCAEPLKPLNTPALSIISTRAPPCLVS